MSDPDPQPTEVEVVEVTETSEEAEVVEEDSATVDEDQSAEVTQETVEVTPANESDAQAESREDVEVTEEANEETEVVEVVEEGGESAEVVEEVKSTSASSSSIQTDKRSIKTSQSIAQSAQKDETAETVEVIDGPFERTDFAETVTDSSGSPRAVEVAESTHRTPSIVIVPPLESQSTLTRESTYTTQPLTVKRATTLTPVIRLRKRARCRYHLVKGPVFDLVLGRAIATNFGPDILREIALAAGKTVV